MATLLPFLSTLFIVLSALSVAIGWYYIRQGKLIVHQRWMITGSVLAVTFFLIYASRTIFIGNTAFGGPEYIKGYYQTFLIFHVLLASIAAVLGITMLILAAKKRFAKHKRLGPITSIIWFITAITGVAVYLLLYVLFPPGETTNVFRVLLGL